MDVFHLCAGSNNGRRRGRNNSRDRFCDQVHANRIFMRRYPQQRESVAIALIRNLGSKNPNRDPGGATPERDVGGNGVSVKEVR
jgi:hypothetical protein